jgi:ubiquinone/menaquinone biosynthesis C-methylase UbiE
MELAKNLAKIVYNKNGVEIGGISPSGSIIYSLTKNLDNIIYSQDKIVIKKNKNQYHYKQGKVGKVIINDATNLESVKDNTYDYLYASHVLEHIANPIRALEEWLRVVKNGGFLILILPEKSKTFDHKRSISTFDTIINQYKNNVNEDDLSTLSEILKYHDVKKDPGVKTLEEFKERSYNNYENRCLHQYVYDKNLLKQICTYLKCKYIYSETRGLNIWFILQNLK